MHVHCTVQYDKSNRSNRRNSMCRVRIKHEKILDKQSHQLKRHIDNVL